MHFPNLETYTPKGKKAMDNNQHPIEEPQWTIQDESGSDEDSLIEEQAQVLNVLRKERLTEMIKRTRKEIEQRLYNPENSAKAITSAVLKAPDPLVDVLTLGYTRSGTRAYPEVKNRSCCF